jgi:3-dehydroquinate synthetase
VRSLSFTWQNRDRGTSVIVGSRPDLSPEMVAGEGETRFWVVDSRLADLWPEPLGEALSSGGRSFVFEASEQSKSMSVLEGLLRALAEAGAHRGWRMVAAGGGITMDVAALAASLYNRGMHLTLAPTTLLGMVDACLGGKTGINLGGVKNQVGTIYPAERVAVFTDFVTTLPDKEVRNGLAEALKMAVIADRRLAGLLSEGFRSRLPEIVERCLRAKASVIGDDLADRGRRHLLNLGHTLGHALEGHSGFGLGHGEAVGLGMLAAAWMGGRMEPGSGMLPRLREIMEDLGLPTRLSAGVTAGEIMEYVRHDKKTVSGGRRWIIPLDWERCRIERLSPGAEREMVEGALEAISP